MREVDCPLCGAGTHGRWRAPGSRRLVRCRECGLVYANPVPDVDEQARSAGDSRVYTDDQLAKRAFFRRRAHELLEAIERLQGKPGRLLDVGCGIGTELEVARERGWRGTGIELSAASVKVARSNGVHVIDRPLAEAGLAPASFDCVTINHALEHIPNVQPVLDQIRRLLRPAGLLFVSVPNLAAWPHRLGAHRLGLAFNDDHHLFFTRATLGRLLKGRGFSVLAISTPRWIDFQRRPAGEYPAPFRMVNGAVERLGLGLEIFALAQVG